MSVDGSRVVSKDIDLDVANTEQDVLDAKHRVLADEHHLPAGVDIKHGSASDANIAHRAHCGNAGGGGEDDDLPDLQTISDSSFEDD